MPKKNKQTIAAKVRNKIAANPLLMKGGSHHDKRADERMARSRSRRALRKQYKAWNSDGGSGSCDKENWQKVVGKCVGVSAANLTALCQFSLSPFQLPDSGKPA